MVLLIYSSLTVIQKQSKTAFFFSICNNFLNIALDSFFFFTRFIINKLFRVVQLVYTHLESGQDVW